jgi:hypothetical protein
MNTWNKYTTIVKLYLVNLIMIAYNKKNHDHMETSILLFSSNTRNRNCNLKKKTLGKGTFIKKVHLPCNISSEKGRDF